MSKIQWKTLICFICLFNHSLSKVVRFGVGVFFLEGEQAACFE